MHAMLPSVSIVIPAFNHERYVIQTLDSCLDSGHPDVELVICDDASVDGTAGLVGEWVDAHRSRFRRIQFLRHTRNVGLSASLNEMVGAATGEFIQLMESDDYFLPGGLLAKTQWLADHPEWQAVFCDGRAVGPEDELYLPSIVAGGSFLPSRLTAEGMGEELLYHWGPPVHQMTWRRTMFKAHGGGFEFDATVFCEDYDVALWLAGHRALGYLPAICQAYRYRSFPQTSNRDYVRTSRDNAHVLAKHAHRFEPHVRAGYRLFSQIHSSRAIGDNIQAGYLERMREAGHEEYLQRVESTGDGILPPPAVDTTDNGILIDALKHHIQLLEKKLAKRKAEIHQAREAARVNLQRHKDLLADARNQLRHHSANPVRALALWWRKTST